MWVQLKTIYYVEIAGIKKALRPGDWFDLGKQEALALLAKDQAWAPDKKELDNIIDKTSGIVFTSENEALQKRLESLTYNVLLSEPHLHYSETLILNPECDIRIELIPTGFNLLRKWQLAIPLLSYEKLAVHIGTDEERAETLEVIKDLRVPIKNVDIIFAQRCEETEALIEMWQNDVTEGKNKYLSFLRAFYIIKPICCDLPTNWVKSSQ